MHLGSGIRKSLFPIPDPGSKRHRFRIGNTAYIELDPSISRVVLLDHRKKKANSICTLGEFKGFFISFSSVLYRNKEYYNIVMMVRKKTFKDNQKLHLQFDLQFSPNTPSVIK
jgi:hypothetical protein